MSAPDTAKPDNRIRACVAYDRSGQRVGDVALEDISDMPAQPDRFVWVGLYEPDAALLAQGPGYARHAQAAVRHAARADPAAAGSGAAAGRAGAIAAPAR